MHHKDMFNQIREFINGMETKTQTLAKVYGVEHLAGPQGFTVSYLFENQDKEIFIKDIEKILNISKSVASSLMKRMEKNGFIQLIPSQKDKRYKAVALTELGKEKAQAVLIFRDELHAQLLKDIDSDDLRVAYRVFDQIRQNLELKEE